MTLFKVGDVVSFPSDQAKNYSRKYKHHLCVCCREGLYLFINSKRYDGDFVVRHEEFTALPNQQSYISCSTVVQVTDNYLIRINATSKGRLSNDFLQRLLDHIEESEVMEETSKVAVIDSLADALSW